MVWLSVNPDGSIMAFNPQPELLSEEIRLTGIMFDGVIPQPEFLVGKVASPRYDAKTNSIYYVYNDRPLTAEEELAQLKSKYSAQVKRLEQMEADTMVFQDFVIEVMGGM